LVRVIFEARQAQFVLNLSAVNVEVVAEVIEAAVLVAQAGIYETQ
jgi:hypothetical protein